MTEHRDHAAEFLRLQDETRAARLSFLLTELDAGNALLDTVEASRSPESRGRARDLAREAYDQVTRGLASVDAGALGDAERAEITALHARLGARLEGAG
jgi:hypothetical protein